MTESVLDEFDEITSSAQLGMVLRRLRGLRTQQNIADHAKRANFYIHRPDLSAIENGRRLPTANELRGILQACGRVDLVSRLDLVRQQLQAAEADTPAPAGRAQPIRHPTRRPWPRLRIGALALAVMATVTATCFVLGVIPWPWSTETNPDHRIKVPRPLPEELAKDQQHCANRTAVIDNDDGEAGGSIRLRECQDTIEMWVADLKRDSRCIYAEVRWSAESTQRTYNSCPAGEIEITRWPKITSDYQIELVSTFHP